MNQLKKNRLIGGGVLLFAALLFSPSILAPKENATGVTISLANKTPAPPVEIATQQKLPAIVMPQDQQNTRTSTPSQATAAPAAISKPTPPGMTSVKTSVANGSWVRVANVANIDTATNLKNRLQVSYPVIIKTVPINGKNYHRVLVGPFTDEMQLKQVRDALKNAGYNTAIQR